jgi:hypothetical protein
MLAQQCAGYDGEYRCRAAVHDRRAEAPYDPCAELEVGQYREVVHVFEDRETGTDRESVDRRIHEEPDTIAADQEPDDQCLERFFDKRRDVSGVHREIDAEPIESGQADWVARNRRNATKHDDADYPFQRYELVTVEVDKRGQETTDGQQAEQGM